MRALQFLVIFSLIFNSPFALAAETSGENQQTSTENRPAQEIAQTTNETDAEDLKLTNEQRDLKKRLTSDATATANDEAVVEKPRPSGKNKDSAAENTIAFKNKKINSEADHLLEVAGKKLSGLSVGLGGGVNETAQNGRFQRFVRHQNGKIEVEVMVENPNGSLMSRNVDLDQFLAANQKLRDQLDTNFYQLSTTAQPKMDQPRLPATAVAKNQATAPAPLAPAIQPVTTDSIEDELIVATSETSALDYETNSDGELIPRQSAQVENSTKVADEARNRLDYLAEQDGLNGSRLNYRKRESIARELGIYDDSKTAALNYAAVGTKKESKDLFDKLFPGKKDFDGELLRQSMCYNPRGGYLSSVEFVNAEKFVKAIRKIDIDGSTLSLSERRLLNRYTDRAPLYARQITAETPLISRQSLEAVVPPRVTNIKVSSLAARGDEIVAQVIIKPDLARPGDQVQLKNFDSNSDLQATFVRKNKDGSVRVKDSRGKELNLSSQASEEAKYYRGLTAELKVNGSLNESTRIEAAQDYLKRPLTPAQKQAIVEAYDVGGKERGFFDYTPNELRQKTEFLRKAGFSVAESSLILRKGLVGNTPKELAQVLKVDAKDIRKGDHVTIDQFNGTGELRGEIAGSANNGGVILREANGAETIIYKSDLENPTNARITRDFHRRSIASDDESISLNRAALVAVGAVKKPVIVPVAEIRNGDRIVINEFNGAGELSGFVVGATKNGGYTIRDVHGVETIIYKTDLEDITNAQVLREWGSPLPEPKNESHTKIDFSADSSILVSKEMKNNPDIVVPLGNGELRQGRVIAKTSVKPGLAKAYMVEYTDEVGVIDYVQITQDQLLAANNPEALKKVKADLKRSAEYQGKSNAELQKILDEGHRAAKDAVGKGRTVDKPDLNAATQTALSELARRSGVTSNAVFEAYRRGGIKGVESLALTQNTLRLAKATAVHAVTPIIIKPLTQLKTGDFVVTAGIGDKVKLPKPVGSVTEGIVLAREKINGEVVYTVGLKKENTVITQNITDRELGDANSNFVGIKADRVRSSNPETIRAQIETDFSNAKNEIQLAEIRRKSHKKSEDRNKILFDDAQSNPHLANNAGVTTPEGSVYTNFDQNRDERFSKLLNIETDLSVDEINAATVNFTVDKLTVIAQSKAGKPGVANRAVKRDIAHMQTNVDRRQASINATRYSLDYIDESLGSLIAKDVGRLGNANYTVWEVTVNKTGEKTGSVKINFSTPVNMSRAEAMGQLREFSRQERIKLLNAQSRLEYDKAYLAELRTIVGVVKRPEPLQGGSFFVQLRNKELSDELDSVLAVRGRATGLRNVDELNSSHPLTPLVEKQRQIMSRLDRIDRQLQPESFTRTATNVANDFAKIGDLDLAIPYYRAAADTVHGNLGPSAKSFWSNEANAKSVIRSGFVSDNADVARMATDKLISLKANSTKQDILKKVALDQYHNLGYEYDRILYGVKRYGNKNKEIDLLVIRKQQQYLSQKYQLKNDIEGVFGKEAWQKMDDQADLTVEGLLQNPQQIVEPDRYKKNQRLPASAPPATPSSKLPVEQKVEGRVTKATFELESQVNSYIEALKSADLSPKEIKSILHQEDLIKATRNPVVAKVMEKAQVDIQGLKFGMLDSDVGKIVQFQENLLLKNTKESEELFDTIRGIASTSAAKEVKSILQNLGFTHPSLLNPKISNQEIRDIIAEVPVLRGYLHELPGMQLAIRDLNAGNITSEQFRERFLANLGHNGPDDGFWGFLSGQIVPASLANAKHPKAKVFFQNSIFEGEKLSNGVVKPKYPMPQSAAGIVHSTFDRLSQGTRGGVDKIFYELGGAPLAANPKAPIRDIGVPPNKGLQLPQEMLLGNPEKTMRQLQALQQYAATAKQLSKVQQTELSSFVGGATHRLQKQIDYINDHLELVHNAQGSIERMTLKFIDELGNDKKLVFNNESSAVEIAQGMERLLLHEERLHGEPFKNFKLAQSQQIVLTESGKLDQRHSYPALDYLLVNIAKRSKSEKAQVPEVVVFLKTYKNDSGFATWLKTKDVPNTVHYDVKGHAQKLLSEYRSLNRKPASVQDSITVNLADDHLQDPSRLNAWQNERQINFKRSQYDNVISSLKKGDTVQAPSAISGKVENFELGDYIGSGNTSNLYEINGSNNVIRIPYLTTDTSEKNSAKEFFATYVQMREKYLGIPDLDVVKVQDHGKNFEYIVNEKVNIRMTLNQVEDRLYELKSGKKLSKAENEEFTELQAAWDKFAKMAPEIAKRSNDQSRVSSLLSAKASDRDMALAQQARQVALTPDGRLVLLDWE